MSHEPVFVFEFEKPQRTLIDVNVIFMVRKTFTHTPHLFFTDISPFSGYLTALLWTKYQKGGRYPVSRRNDQIRSGFKF